MQNKTLSVPQPNNNDPHRRLVARLKACPPHQAAAVLVSAESSLAFEALAELNPSFTQDILSALPEGRRQAIINSATPQLARQWERNRSFEAGTIVPLTLKRFGTDPATASSIFLTTATDIVSMGLLLGLATILIR